MIPGPLLTSVSSPVVSAKKSIEPAWYPILDSPIVIDNGNYNSSCHQPFSHFFGQSVDKLFFWVLDFVRRSFFPIHVNYSYCARCRCVGNRHSQDCSNHRDWNPEQ